MRLETLIQNIEALGFDSGKINENKYILGKREVSPGVFEIASFSKAFWVLKNGNKFKIEYNIGQLFEENYFSDAETTLDFIKENFSLDEEE